MCRKLLPLRHHGECLCPHITHAGGTWEGGGRERGGRREGEGRERGGREGEGSEGEGGGRGRERGGREREGGRGREGERGEERGREIAHVIFCHLALQYNTDIDHTHSQLTAKILAETSSLISGSGSSLKKAFSVLLMTFS